MLNQVDVTHNKTQKQTKQPQQGHNMLNQHVKCQPFCLVFFCLMSHTTSKKKQKNKQKGLSRTC